MTVEAPFHEGERALQLRAGSAQRLAQAGPRVIRDHMPQQHRDFFPLLPFLVVGAVDGDGQPWASLVAGPPGFVHSPDERRLRIAALPARDDPLHGLLRTGAPVGLLGIEQHTRRRNRMNGTVRGPTAAGFDVEVGQSFGNCPKYIQARPARFEPDAPAPGALEHGAPLDAAAVQAIEAADTFFIATAHPRAGIDPDPAFGVDVSHRGGKPGFVRVQGDVLTVPDFVGNGFFNTFGNLQLNPRCGLVFVDFDAGDALWVAARGEVVEEGDDVRAFEGAQRLLRLRVTGWRRQRRALPLRWGMAEPAPELARTGAW